MSLRKSPTLTPARLAANRRNAKKSTGPRTARGKSQSRMNSLRTGGRSALYEDIFLTLLDAPPGAVDRMARAILTPEQAAHPLFAEAVDMFRQAEIEVAEHFRRQLAKWKSAGGSDVREAHGLGHTPFGPTVGKKNSFLHKQSLNVIENTG